MILYVNAENITQHAPALDSMFRDRKRVFIDMLQWDVPVDGEYERDDFDDECAEYFLISDPETGSHHASMRILRTDRPHLLDTVFPYLCEHEIPRGKEYRELTRLCISPSLRPRQRIHARNRLFSALVEYALMQGIKGYTGVSEMAVYRQVLALGWRCSPLGLPRNVDGQIIGAILAHIEPATIDLFRAAGTYEEGRMAFLDDGLQAA